MSGESGVGALRRAFAELTDPAAGTIADFAAAEEGAAELDPDLPLLEVDVFGGIAPPARGSRAEAERRTRRAPTPLERLAAATSQAPATKSSSAQRQAGGPGTPGSDATRRIDAAPAAPDAVVAPVFRLAGDAPLGRGAELPASQAATAQEAAQAATAPADSGRAAAAAAGAASSETAAAPVAGAPAAGAAAASETALGTVSLIAELTESILAATAAGAANAGRGAASSAAAQGQGAGGDSAFLAETLRSLGGETAAAFGVEPTAEPRAEAGAGGLAEAPAPLAAAGSPGSADAPHAVPHASPTPAGSGPVLGIVPRPGEADADPAALAELVNDALVEQARRHGLELG